MTKLALSFLRQYLAYYASAVLGGFAALWIQAQGLFAVETLSYIAAIVFMPSVVKAIHGGESFVEHWKRINAFLEQQQAEPGTATPVDIEKLVDERMKALLELSTKTDASPPSRSTELKI